MKVDFNIEAVWGILVHACGAPSHLRETFEYHIKHGGQEFRFQGRIGFGGKFYHQHGRIWVACYPEDQTPKHEEIMRKANAALAKQMNRHEPEGASP